MNDKKNAISLKNNDSKSLIIEPFYSFNIETEIISFCVLNKSGFIVIAMKNSNILLMDGISSNKLLKKIKLTKNELKNEIVSIKSTFNDEFIVNYDIILNSQSKSQIYNFGEEYKCFERNINLECNEAIALSDKFIIGITGDNKVILYKYNKNIKSYIKKESFKLDDLFLFNPFRINEQLFLLCKPFTCIIFYKIEKNENKFTLTKIKAIEKIDYHGKKIRNNFRVFDNGKLLLIGNEASKIYIISLTTFTLMKQVNLSGKILRTLNSITTLPNNLLIATFTQAKEMQKVNKKISQNKLSKELEICNLYSSTKIDFEDDNNEEINVQISSFLYDSERNIFFHNFTFPENFQSKIVNLTCILKINNTPLTDIDSDFNKKFKEVYNKIEKLNRSSNDKIKIITATENGEISIWHIYFNNEIKNKKEDWTIL